MDHNIAEEDGTQTEATKGLKMVKPRGVVLLFHGLNSHSNSFGHVAKRFAEAGMDVVAFDQKGFGKSQGKRGYISSYRQMIKTNFEFYAKVKDYYLKEHDCVLGTPMDAVGRSAEDGKTRIPVFLFGQSMGGLIALQMAAKLQKEIQGLMLLSPAVRPIDQHAFLWKQFLIFGVWWMRQMGGIFRWLTFRNKNLKSSLRNKPTLQFYQADRLNYKGRISWRTFSQILKGMSKIQKSLHTINHPMVIAQSGSDKVIS